MLELAETTVNLSRLQFALTAMYHFIFVPLTIGLSFILAIMESVYVLTNKQIYKDMTKFWGKLFTINFAMGVATGITMEFQFGTNWAYYAYYVGDIFGVPLAIEGLMAFFLESTMIGIFIFGWNKLSKLKHLTVTWLLALGTSLSSLWILIANAWMQHPVGAEFNIETLRMELTDIGAIIFSPVAQVKFVHTVAAGYVTGSIFVLSISSYYLLKGRYKSLAMRSFAIATGFGIASIFSVLLLGDESGYSIGEVQKTKLALIEGVWETEPAPAPLTLIGWPDNETQETKYAIQIPYLLGIIATRSLDTPVIGLKEIIKGNEYKIKQGILAVQYLDLLRKDKTNQDALSNFNEVKQYLGFGLLAKRYVKDLNSLDSVMISEIAKESIPKSWVLFWAFRLMVGFGLIMLGIFAIAFYYNAKKVICEQRWFLKVVVYALPLPWLAIFCGWIVAEYGRQPWVVGHHLPTYMGVSSTTSVQVMSSLLGLVVLYTLLLIIELFLMVKYIKIGPQITQGKNI
ncbi:MAG: cytochrome bd-I ubiquinol oxidase subunit CydA [Francisellaceae bacterium]|jgi:cytochrome bd ubiquinol oxidase subunit I|nr:cytochrome bd-I ubiquinol oxidase subunit CydA [Francisellaceae bacterium]